MISNFILLLFFIPIIESKHLLSLPSITLDPNHYTSGDKLVHDFRGQFHPSIAYRCLLQTESSHFYFGQSCQLQTRSSLLTLCPLNYTLKLEIVLPQNTTVFLLPIQIQYSKIFHFNLTREQHSIRLPFDCHEQLSVNKGEFIVKQNQFHLGNAQFVVHRIGEEQQCQFEKNPYRVRIKENDLIKDFLQLRTGTCQCRHFALAPSNSRRNFDYFTIDSSSGRLSLIRPLDYESVTSWKLVVQAQDPQGIPFYTYIIVDVEDVNDCPPILSWNFPLHTVEIINDSDIHHLEIAIHESKTRQADVVIANLVASDLDTPPTDTSEPAFRIDLDSKQTTFQIHGPFADSTFVLSTRHPLDREVRDRYYLTLTITDNGQPPLSSVYTLLVHILDENDNRPQFDSISYSVDIRENNPINVTLLQVHANDSDAGNNGLVTYALTEPHHKWVWIDGETGVVRAKIKFDYEKMSNFSFNVTATDHAERRQQLQAIAEVHVRVINENDNVPIFSQSSYEFSLYENNPPRTYLGQVSAFDNDGSSVTYTLDNPSQQISSLFYISSSDGKLYALDRLDREQLDEYTFDVIATDGQHTSTRATIRVHVLDVNDEMPRFAFPNDNNDTLIIDRTYWQNEDYICQIEIQDHDEKFSHTLTLIQRLNELTNYGYLHEDPRFFFDSGKFYLDSQARLFFNSSNGTILDEGVYYLAFKVTDGEKYFDEKLLKLIVVNNYERVQTIVKQFDHLGSHLNNRIAHLQYRSSNHHRHFFAPSTSSLSIGASNKFIVLIVITVLSIILIGITFIFISLVRRKSHQKTQLKQADTSSSSSTSSSSGQPSDSSTLTLFKANPDKRQSLRVSNCYDYTDMPSPSMNSASLLMLNNKDNVPQTPLMSDACCLLEKMNNEKDFYDEQRQKTYSSWVLSTANRPDSRYSQRSDSSTFHSLNRLSIPSSPLAAGLSHQLCSPKRHSTTTYESTNGSMHPPPSSSNIVPSSQYTVAIVSSSTNNSPHTPVGSDDGFCGSSDISDPPGGGSSTLSSSSHQHHLCRQPYTMMKEGIMLKKQQQPLTTSPSFNSLLNRLSDPSSTTNGTDTTRRVRFNLDPEQQQRTILPLPSNSTRAADHALRRFEQLYMTRDDVLPQSSIESTLLYTNSTVV